MDSVHLRKDCRGEAGTQQYLEPCTILFKQCNKCSAVQYLRQLTAAMYEYRCSPERYEASVAEHPRGAQASVRWTGDGARGGSGGWGVYRNAALEYLRFLRKSLNAKVIFQFSYCLG